MLIIFDLIYQICSKINIKGIRKYVNKLKHEWPFKQMNEWINKKKIKNEVVKAK